MRFLLGVIGGAAPEVIRLYEARLDTDRRPLGTRFYWIITILFLLLAGTAATLTAANGAAALAIGVQTPFVIRGIEASGSTRKGATGIEELTLSHLSRHERAWFRLRQQVRLLRFS